MVSHHETSSAGVLSPCPPGDACPPGDVGNERQWHHY